MKFRLLSPAYIPEEPELIHISPDYFVYRLPQRELLAIEGSTGQWCILSPEPDSLRKNIKGLSKYFSHNLRCRKREPDTNLHYVDSWSHSHSRLFVIHLTSKCNLRCSYCYALRKIDDISLTTLDEILQFILCISPSPSLQLIGGEPFLRYDLINHVYNFLSSNIGSSFRLLLQTNGTILNDSILEFVNKPEVRVGVSIDGDHAANASRITKYGERSSDQVEKFISSLSSNGLFPNLNVVLNRNNLPRLKESISYFLSMGVKSVKFSVIYNGCELTDFDKLFIYLSDLYSWYLSNNIWKYLLLVDLLRLLRNCLTSTRDYMCLSSPCGAGINHFAFDSNGKIYACDFALGIPEFMIGNMKNDSPENLIKASIKRNSFIQVDTNLNCKRCALRKICGNCQVSSFSNNKTLNNKKIECVFMKRMIPWLMSLIHTEPSIKEFLSHHTI